MAVPARPVSGAPIETSWGDVVHDGFVAMDLQAGFVDQVLSAASTAVNVTFPRPFASAPVVVVSINNAVAVHFTGKIVAPGPTAAGFPGVISSATNTNVAGTIRMYWIAYGPRA